MSLTAGCVTAVVILARQFLRRAPKKYSYLLWLVVAFRLVCPFSFNSDISVFNLKAFNFINGNAYQSESDENTADTMTNANTNADAGADVKAGASGMTNPDVAYIYRQGNYTLADTRTGDGTVGVGASGGADGSTRAGLGITAIAAFAWAAGVIVMAMYGGASYVLLQRKLKKALKIGDNVYRSDKINTPFVMGIVHPRIYVPCFLDKSALEYVLLHERCHIKRHDYIVKMVSFVLLCIHWFNPLIWLAFHLMGKDMEMSCDEMVVEKMNVKHDTDTSRINKDYSYALLSCAAAGRFPAPGPLCFGDISVKGRIKNVLNYRKPKKVMNVIAVVLCMGVLAACSANPKTVNANDSTLQNDMITQDDTTQNEKTSEPATNSEAQKTPDETDGETTKAVDIIIEADVNVTNVKAVESESASQAGDAQEGHSEELREAVYNACVEYHMDPQEVWDLLDNSDKYDKVSIYTQCKMYHENERDEWREKMAAYYGDDWENMYTNLTQVPVYPMPVENATLTVGYGYREKSDGTTALHPEDDFEVEEGSEVHAAADGTVQSAGWFGDKGYGVVIGHDDGYMTGYYHLQSVNVSEGDKVKAGDVIGLTGQSGNATGPMFSFAVSRYDENNELQYIQPVYREGTYTELDVEYYANADGTYTCGGNTYSHKLEVSGLEGESQVTYIVLTNNEEVSFEDVRNSLIRAEMVTGVPEFVILGWY